MTWLVAGLGNPGPRYVWTRHNVGFMVADELARRAGERFTAPRGMHAEVATTRIGAAGIGVPGGEALLIVKPRTFMNDSGRAVGPLAEYHRVAPDHVIVVHDELDLDPGRIRRIPNLGDFHSLGNLDEGSIGPQTLQSIEFAVLFVLDMHHDFAVIQQDPAALFETLAAVQLAPTRVQSLVYGLDDGAHLALVRPRSQDKHISQNQALGNIQGDDLGGLLLFRGLSGRHRQFNRFRVCAHQISW